MYHQLKRWPGTLLYAGGIMDQPAWSWILVDTAGTLFKKELADLAEDEYIAQEASKNIDETIKAKVATL